MYKTNSQWPRVNLRYSLSEGGRPPRTCEEVREGCREHTVNEQALVSPVKKRNG